MCRYNQLITLLLFLFAVGGQAQDFVFPGDVNNNGLVDHYDVLPMGYAYGHLGPTRLAVNHSEPQEIIEHWSTAFPDGLNFIYADADGNGIVDILDFFVLGVNQGVEHSDLEPLVFPEGQQGVDPTIRINQGIAYDPTSGQTQLTIPITLESFQGTDTLNGLAFNLEFDPTYIAQINFNFTEGWINADGQAVEIVLPEFDRIRIAATRLGENAIPLGGEIGTVELIIIDDLIGLLPEQDSCLALLEVAQVQAFDGDYHPVPIAVDTLTIDCSAISAAVSTVKLSSNLLQATVYPNPTIRRVQLEADYAFEQVELIDSQGRRETLYRGPPIQQWQQSLGAHPPGIYYLRLTGPRGQSLLRLLKG